MELGRNIKSIRNFHAHEMAQMEAGKMTYNPIPHLQETHAAHGRAAKSAARYDDTKHLVPHHRAAQANLRAIKRKLEAEG